MTLLAGQAGAKPEAWLYDLGRGVGARFSSATRAATFPCGRRTGARSLSEIAGGGVSVKAADGTSAAQGHLAREHERLASLVVPDGKLMLLRSRTPKSGRRRPLAALRRKKAPGALASSDSRRGRRRLDLARREAGWSTSPTSPADARSTWCPSPASAKTGRPPPARRSRCRRLGDRAILDRSRLDELFAVDLEARGAPLCRSARRARSSGEAGAARGLRRDARRETDPVRRTGGGPLRPDPIRFGLARGAREEVGAGAHLAPVDPDRRRPMSVCMTTQYCSVFSASARS